MFEKREFIHHTGKSPQQTESADDEQSTTIPVGTRNRGTFGGIEQLASGECGLIQLWGDPGRKLPAECSGTPSGVRRASGQRGAEMATVFGQEALSFSRLFPGVEQVGGDGT